MENFDRNRLDRIEAENKTANFKLDELLQYQDVEKQSLLRQIKWLKKQDSGVLADQVDELRKG